MLRMPYDQVCAVMYTGTGAETCAGRNSVCVHRLGPSVTWGDLY